MLDFLFSFLGCNRFVWFLYLMEGGYFSNGSQLILIQMGSVHFLEIQPKTQDFFFLFNYHPTHCNRFSLFQTQWQSETNIEEMQVSHFPFHMLSFHLQRCLAVPSYDFFLTHFPLKESFEIWNIYVYSWGRTPDWPFKIQSVRWAMGVAISRMVTFDCLCRNQHPLQPWYWLKSTTHSTVTTVAPKFGNKNKLASTKPTGR